VTWVDLDAVAADLNATPIVKVGDVKVVYPLVRSKTLVGPTEIEKERLVLFQVGSEARMLTLAQVSALSGALVGILDEERKYIAEMEGSPAGAGERDRSMLRTAREALLERFK